MQARKALLHNEHGIVLAISLMILTLLMAAGIGAIFSTQLDLRSSGNLRTARQAFYIAEAGLHRAWQELDNGDGTNDFEEVFAKSSVTTLFNNAGFGGGSYTVTAQAIAVSLPRRIKVTSTGCFPAGAPCPSGHSKAIIETQLKRGPLFPCVLCGRENVTLSGGAITDSYDSKTGPYNPATAGNHGAVGSNGDITLSGTATVVRGNATASGTVVTSGGATVAGVTTNNASNLRLPKVSPCGPPYSPATGISGGTYDPSTGELRGTGSDAIIVPIGTYCFSSVSLEDASTLTISGPVTLYVTGASSFTGGGVINTTANAEYLKIFSSLSSSTAGVAVASGSSAYMTLYAPDTGVVVTKNGDLFGAIAGRTILNTSGARFHYDSKLKDNEDGKVEMVFWKETF